MVTKVSPMELHDLSSKSEGSDSGSEWDDSGEDPDYDMLEETHNNFSNLSLRNEEKKRVVKDKDLANEIDSKLSEIDAPSLDDAKLERVQTTIKAGLLEKLKVDECKLYLKNNGLRLTGNKDTLIQRIKEHLEILNGDGEKKYPSSSFVLNCKGDACTGDVVFFEQNVYEMYNIASRSASGPPCGKRIVAGRIVKESYGAAKQQHTFTIEVLWSKGEKPLPPLHPLLIKGRNLYRLKTLRQKWEDEDKRRKTLLEKYSRGSVARADREARIQEKERRKKSKENRISKKDSAKNQCHRHSCMAMSQHQPQERNASVNPEKPEFPSQHSVLPAKAIYATSAIVNKPAAVTEQPGQSIEFRTVRMGFNHLGNSGKTSLSANYNLDDIHSGENQTTFENHHPLIVETNRFRERNHQRRPFAIANHLHLMMPSRGCYMASANRLHPLIPNRESYKQNQPCKHFARGRCYYGDNCKFLHDLREKRNV